MLTYIGGKKKTKTPPPTLKFMQLMPQIQLKATHSQANIISLREIFSSHRLVGAEFPSHSPGAWKRRQERRTEILKEGKTEVYLEADISSLLLQQPKHHSSLPYAGQFSVRKRTESHVMDWLRDTSRRHEFVSVGIPQSNGLIAVVP